MPLGMTPVQSVASAMKTPEQIRYRMLYGKDMPTGTQVTPGYAPSLAISQGGSPTASSDFWKSHDTIAAAQNPTQRQVNAYKAATPEQLGYAPAVQSVTPQPVARPNVPTPITNTQPFLPDMAPKMTQPGFTPTPKVDLGFNVNMNYANPMAAPSVPESGIRPTGPWSPQTNRFPTQVHGQFPTRAEPSSQLQRNLSR